MSGDESIPIPGRSRKARNLAVTPESESTPHARAMAEHPKHRFRAATDGSIGLDQVNGRTEIFVWDVLNKTLSDRLEWSEINAFTRGLLPSPDPADTKCTALIIDEKRLLSRRDAVVQAIRTTNILHVLISSIAHSSHNSH
jgi:hypothetical protein